MKRGCQVQQRTGAERPRIARFTWSPLHWFVRLCWSPLLFFTCPFGHPWRYGLIDLFRVCFILRLSPFWTSAGAPVWFQASRPWRPCNSSSRGAKDQGNATPLAKGCARPLLSEWRCNGWCIYLLHGKFTKRTIWVEWNSFYEQRSCYKQYEDSKAWKTPMEKIS